MGSIKIQSKTELYRLVYLVMLLTCWAVWRAIKNVIFIKKKFSQSSCVETNMYLILLFPSTSARVHLCSDPWCSFLTTHVRILTYAF
ncbi:hypothetical protein Hanom_Chr02g00177291 [Helianthus anomalus]